MSDERLYSKPPDFMTDKRNYKQYRKDLLRWQRCTSVSKSKQGDIVLLYVPSNHPVKERLENECGATVVDNEKGVEEILKVLDAVYGEDEVMESYLLFRELEQLQRHVGQDIMEYVSQWETHYLNAKAKGIDLHENVKAFKLLMTSNLDELDMKLVLSEVDMKSEDGKKKLFEQVKSAVRKYHSAGALQSHRATTKTLFTDSQMSQIEEVFVAKGWSRPDEQGSKKIKRRRVDEETSKKKENGHDKDGHWRKCFKCVKECTHGKKKCECPCSSHLLPTCPKLKEEKSAQEKTSSGPSLGLYSQALFSTLGISSENAFVVVESENVGYETESEDLHLLGDVENLLQNGNSCWNLQYGALDSLNLEPELANSTKVHVVDLEEQARMGLEQGFGRGWVGCSVGVLPCSPVPAIN